MIGRMLKAEIPMASQTDSAKTGQKMSMPNAMATNEANVREYEAPIGVKPFTSRIKSVVKSQIPLTMAKLAAVLLTVAIEER